MLERSVTAPTTVGADRANGMRDIAWALSTLGPALHGTPNEQCERGALDERSTRCPGDRRANAGVSCSGSRPPPL